MSDQGTLHQRSTDYGKIPARLMHDQTVTDGAKVLYAHMHWRYGNNHKNFESLASMAKELGVSDQTIVNRIAELEAANWVVTIKRKSADGRKFLSNFYHVFEVQGAAKRWRNSFQKTETEELSTVPEARVRKSRRGKGGNPNNLKKAKSIPTQVGSAVPTQVGQETVPIQVGTDDPTQVGTIQSHYIQSQERKPNEPPKTSAVVAPPILTVKERYSCADSLIAAWCVAYGYADHSTYTTSYRRRDALKLFDLGADPDEIMAMVSEKIKGRDKEYLFKYVLEDYPEWKHRQNKRDQQDQRDKQEQEASEAYRRWYATDVLGRRPA